MCSQACCREMAFTFYDEERGLYDPCALFKLKTSISDIPLYDFILRDYWFMFCTVRHGI